jgi:tRNA A-37 threonylcarbamoyl transferase component Bud32/tetratricopeptide (TPR) repeat protein
MSRVFVADEVRLGRKVVIKVLSPDLAQGISVERFEREIKVAASLQQANIVPVLTAGDTNGLPYFTMPFVDGESLRHRLSLGPIPIATIVAILRDVTRALAYAHARGVVHRDIKPDNVLLSGGTAVVTDFGIAKAISAARTEVPGATLTQLGTSLGTPAYMAPEQVAGDPNLDARVDLYALGCMAYELLTGQQPFANRTPQKMMAAHLSEAVPSATTLRPDTPLVLADLVTRLMAKDPGNRPQSATDVLQVLDEAVTTSAPTMAFSAPGMLKKALLLYAIATVAVLLCTKAAIIAIGLPDWVFPGAVVVMALGLPALLVTAYVQRVARRVATATPTLTPGGTMAPMMPSGTIATMALKASPHVTWRRTGRGGLIAVGGFAALVALFMIARAFGIGPGATLLTAGRLRSTDRLVLSDFQNATKDSTLADAIVEALRVDLSQSRTVHLVPANDVTAALQHMGATDSTRLTAAVAREVAQRANAKAVLTGDIHALGVGYVLTASLIDAGTGQPLVELRETAASDKDLIAAVNQLSKTLRQKIGESLRTIRASEPLEQVTTASLPALQLYSDAVRAANRFDIGRAQDLLEQALKIDTAFAMAWRKLAVVYTYTGPNTARGVAASRNAFRFRDRLPPIERHLTEAIYYSEVTKEPDRAIAAYREVLAIDPDEPASLIDAGGLLEGRLGRFADAEPLLRHGIAVTSLPAMFNNLAFTLVGEEKWAAADSLPGEWLRRGGDTTEALLLDAFIAGPRRDLARGDTVLARGLASSRSTGTLTPLFRFMQLPLDEYRGRLRVAERAGREVVAQVGPATGDRSLTLKAELYAASFDALQRGQPEKAWQEVQVALRRLPLDSLAPRDRPYDLLADLAMLAGESGDVARFRAEAEAATPVGERDSVFEPHWNERVAVAAGRWDSAAAAALRVAELSHCRPCGQYEYAYALDRAGRTDSAMAAYAAVADRPMTGDPDDGYEDDAAWYPFALRRLGELHADRGDKQKAIDYLTRFTTLWKDADPDLQPVVTQAKRRIAELVGEPTKP